MFPTTIVTDSLDLDCSICLILGCHYLQFVFMRYGQIPGMTTSFENFQAEVRVDSWVTQMHLLVHWFCTFFCIPASIPIWYFNALLNWCYFNDDRYSETFVHHQCQMHVLSNQFHLPPLLIFEATNFSWYPGNCVPFYEWKQMHYVWIFIRFSYLSDNSWCLYRRLYSWTESSFWLLAL